MFKLKKMFNYVIIFFIVIVSQCTSPKSSNSILVSLEEKLTVDTILLRDIAFESDLTSVINNCVSYAYDTKSLKRKDVIYLQHLFNKELKTESFNDVGVVTGIKLKFVNYDAWIKVVELHFEKEEATTKVEQLLNKLNRGIIKHTIYPNKCQYLRKHKKKIYLFQYSPTLGEKELWAEDLFNCIN